MLSGLKTWWSAMKEEKERMDHLPETAILLHVGNQEVVLTGMDMLKYEAYNLNRNTGRLLRVKNQLTGRTVDISGRKVSLVERIKYVKATKEVI